MDVVRFQWNVPPAGKLVIVNPDHNPYHFNLAPTGALMGVYHQTIDKIVTLPCGSTIRFLPLITIDIDEIAACWNASLTFYNYIRLEILYCNRSFYVVYRQPQTSFTLFDTRGSARLCFPSYVIDIILIQRLQERGLEFTANRNRCLQTPHCWNPR